LETVLSNSGKTSEVQLAALAQVVDKFLSSKRDSESGKESEKSHKDKDATA
jgi:hypothetical protein